MGNMVKGNLNLRHAAALALVGWYLMVPPVKQTYSWGDDIHYWLDRLPGILPQGQAPFTAAAKCTRNAPISEGTQSDEFESLAECKSAAEGFPAKTKQEIENVEKGLQQEVPGHPGKSAEENREDQEETLCAYYAQCIATEDPRLRGN
jgi:hypothetical protein